MLERIDQGWSDNALTDVQVHINAQNPTAVSPASPNINGPSHSFSECLCEARVSIQCVLGSGIPWEHLTPERSGNTCLSGSREYHIAQRHHRVTSGHEPGNINMENLDACGDETFRADQQGSGTFRLATKLYGTCVLPTSLNGFSGSNRIL